MGSVNPPIVARLVSQLKSNGVAPAAAQAIAISKMQKAGNLKPGTNTATSKGVQRGVMTPGERAKDRAAKASGSPASSFTYNKNNNTAVKGKVNTGVKKRS